MAIVRAQPLYCNDPDALAEIVEQHLQRNRLLKGVSRLGLAVSGGADSVALLHLLHPLCQAAGVTATVLHADHGLRAESRLEAEFVRSLAAEKGLAFLSEELRLAAREPDGTSLEMAARAARQAFFARCCAAADLDAVATGHQADDVAETLVLRLARGAGGTGLAALRPRSTPSPALTRAAGRPFAILRPLLPASGRALREWLTRRGLAWCEDASNQSDAIPRNRVRNRLMPQLETLWGESFRANLCRSADILREEDALLETLAERRLKTVLSGGGIDVPRLRLQPEPLRRRVLRQWLFAEGEEEAAGFESVARLIDFCLAANASRLQLPGGAVAVVDGNRLTLSRPEAAPPPETTVPAPGQAFWGGLEIVVAPYRGICADARGVGCYPAACAIDAGALKGRPLTVRSRRPGDRLFPTGLSGSKKLQDVFVDAKVPEARRDTVPVFTCGDEVVWVPGYRVSRAFRVTAKEAPSLRITVRPRL